MQAWVLWWKLPDGSACGLVRAYADKERADQDFALVQIGSDRTWELQEMEMIGTPASPRPLPLPRREVEPFVAGADDYFDDLVSNSIT